MRPARVRRYFARNEPRGRRCGRRERVAAAAPRPGTGERRRTRPGPGCGRIFAERILAEAEIVCERPQQRGVLWRGAASRAGEGHQKRMQPLAIRAPAKDVKSISYLQLFQLAEKPVELAQRGGGFIARGNTAITLEPGGAGLFEDRRGEHRESTGIAQRSLVILVN